LGLEITINFIDKLVYVGSTSNLNAGEGFTMKGTSGTNATTVKGVQNNPGNKQRYDFEENLMMAQLQYQ
jgi:hypothetical protein